MNGFTRYPSEIDDNSTLFSLTDRATSFLSSDMLINSLTFSVIDGTSFPEGVQIITIEQEKILVSKRQDNIFTIQQRGFEQTSISSHSKNAKASCNWISHYHNNIKNAIIATQTELENFKSQTGSISNKKINTLLPLTGGGDLSSDLTIGINEVTPSSSGSMSSTDKLKLDGISEKANNYIHPNHSGDVVSDGDGITTIQPGVVTNSKLSSGIDANKIANGTVSNSEFQFLDGVTSSIQTQLNSKENTISGGLVSQFWNGLKQFVFITWNDITGKPSSFTPSSHASSHITGGSDIIPNAVASGNSGLMSGLDKLKLDGIQSGATLNSTDAQLRDRSTHTGTQPISSIENLQNSLNSKVVDSFESFVLNLRSYPVINTSFNPGTSLSKTYQTPNGNIVITTNFINGKPSTKVISGLGVPSEIQKTKTYDFTGRTIPLVTYS